MEQTLAENRTRSLRADSNAAGLSTLSGEGGEQAPVGGPGPTCVPAATAADPAVPDRPAFCVRDEGSANWVVRKVKEARAYAGRVEAWAAAEVRRARAEEQFFLDRFGPELEAWTARRLEELQGQCKGRSKPRTIRLPAGEVGFRAEPPRVAVVDETALLAWCGRSLPDAVTLTVEAVGPEALRALEWVRDHCRQARVIRRFSKPLLQRHVRATGERPDGTGVAGGGRKFFLR